MRPVATPASPSLGPGKRRGHRRRIPASPGAWFTLRVVWRRPRWRGEPPESRHPAPGRVARPSAPARAADLSSTCRLGEHLMASHVFQWTWRTLYTCPKPPEPTFSQPANSPASKVRSRPRAHGLPLSPSMARVSLPPCAAAAAQAAQVPRCAPRPLTSLPPPAGPASPRAPGPCRRTEGHVGSLRSPPRARLLACVGGCVCLEQSGSEFLRGCKK